ncbi:hypothetical protein ACFYQA_08570 [Streptomyces sp. NPDC005774]|uniref:hypothetical protein n=1 Tax=Streptomyces sp. NPDC005774 TaxID=3364728 RepID=UPI0036927FB3
MGLTASNKAAVATAIGILICGFAVIVQNTSRDNVAGSIGGACLVMAGLALGSLTFVRRWVCDTSDERRVLAAAQREAQGERSRYFAAQAALENEQGRLTRDMAADRARLTATLTVEREKMQAEFEGSRAQELSEAFQTGVEMERAGMLKRSRPPRGNLLKFPQKQPEALEQDRTREHEAAGP